MGKRTNNTALISKAQALINQTKTYEELVVELIRKKYSLNQELAILRQRDDKVEEFKAYYDYVEECKEQAKKLK